MLTSATTENPPARLLVIDDEAAILRMVRTVLVRAKYDVVTCASGREALTRLQQNSFDCIITDAIMPLMTGYELTKYVRGSTEHGDIPILMLTRKRHREDVKKAVEAGVTDYVLKPIDEYLLLDKVELCLKKGQGKRHIFEYSLNGPQTQAEVAFSCRLVTISETDLTLRLPFPLESEVPFQLKSPLFTEIGIPLPYLKLMRCAPAADLAGATDLPRFEAKFAFVGVQEVDLKKIRAWLRKQEIQRRK